MQRGIRKISMRKPRVAVGFALAGCVLAFGAAQAGAQSKPDAAAGASAVISAMPDVVGIRPGMPAQEAYNTLKARNPNVKVGIGQFMMPGLGDKPTVTSMAAQVVDGSVPETITVWLTTPPMKQVVFAVGRQLEYDQNKPLLRSNVVNSLRQKYGPETATGTAEIFWAYDEQGRRPNTALMQQNNCMARAHFSLQVGAPQGPTFDFVTPLLYAPGPAEFCDSTVKVSAQLQGPNGSAGDYVSRITVVITDQPLARRSQEAYQAYLANGAAAKQREELEKAKQRKGPEL
jgi:hypothetical protein